jgi:phage pi2 protein 07
LCPENRAYISLPNPIPQDLGTKLYGLGLAQGMSVAINGKVILWNSVNKTVALPQGVSSFIITGVTKKTRTCSITRYNDVLTWPQTGGCLGVVHNGGVLYFPAF